MGIAERFQEGGDFMYVILLFGVLTIGFIIERTIVLFKKFQSPAPTFRDDLLKHITSADFDSAEALATTAAGSTAVGRVAALGCRIRARGGGEEELQARMDESLTSEISAVDRRTGFLAMFGNVATLAGLLGTIVGMIRSFSAVAQANPVDRATMLSQGISEAMNCTAFGLLVAIPALVAYAVFQNRTDRIVAELTESVTRIYHDLLFYSEPKDEGLLAAPRRGKDPVVVQPGSTLSV